MSSKISVKQMFKLATAVGIIAFLSTDLPKLQVESVDARKVGMKINGAETHVKRITGARKKNGVKTDEPRKFIPTHPPAKGITEEELESLAKGRLGMRARALWTRTAKPNETGGGLGAKGWFRREESPIVAKSPSDVNEEASTSSAELEKRIIKEGEALFIGDTELKDHSKKPMDANVDAKKGSGENGVNDSPRSNTSTNAGSTRSSTPRTSPDKLDVVKKVMNTVENVMKKFEKIQKLKESKEKLSGARREASTPSRQEKKRITEEKLPKPVDDANRRAEETEPKGTKEKTEGKDLEAKTLTYRFGVEKNPIVVTVPSKQQEKRTEWVQKTSNDTGLKTSFKKNDGRKPGYSSWLGSETDESLIIGAEMPDFAVETVATSSSGGQEISNDVPKGPRESKKPTAQRKRWKIQKKIEQNPKAGKSVANLLCGYSIYMNLRFHCLFSVIIGRTKKQLVACMGEHRNYVDDHVHEISRLNM
jgi:hypothetical protein